MGIQSQIYAESVAKEVLEKMDSFSDLYSGMDYEKAWTELREFVESIRSCAEKGFY